MADNTTPPPTTAAAASATTAGTPAGATPATKFEIPETVRAQYPDLVTLILETESMNDDERRYWFQILPIMTEEQVLKLRDILANEKKQLSQLDQEYDKEVKKINQKHVSEWKGFEAAEKRKKLQAQEQESENAETATQEDLLKKLENT